jgi:hypothetical protein
MAGIQDFEIYYDDFNGTVATLPTSADPATAWLIDDTSSGGTPTYTKGTSVATLTLASTSEVENVCLHFGDALDFDIDLIQSIEMRVRLGVVFTTGSELVFGVGSTRNDTTNSVDRSCVVQDGRCQSHHRIVYAESDDGTCETMTTWQPVRPSAQHSSGL